jgi:glycosyltransferase involved in cell wall biosynthesis
MPTEIGFKKKIHFVHILNIQEKGGAQSIVDALMLKTNKDEIHTVMYLATSKIGKWFFRTRKIRILLFIKKAIILTVKIIHNDLFGDKKIIYIFHLAESHYLYRLIFHYVKYFSDNSLYICMIYQSPKLYPKKFISKINKWEDRIDGLIFYSHCVKKEWRANYFFNINENKMQVLHVALKPEFNVCQESKHISSRLQIVYVGRRAEWKHPSALFTIAEKLALKKIPVTLNFVGSNSLADLDLDYIFEYNNLIQINFYGSIETTPDLYSSFHLMVYSVSADLSVETVGLAAIEALASGLIVVVNQKSKSDFRELDSLLDIRELYDLIDSGSKSSILMNLNEKLLESNKLSKTIVKRFSIDEYLNGLKNFLLPLFNKKKSTRAIN